VWAEEVGQGRYLELIVAVPAAVGEGARMPPDEQEQDHNCCDNDSDYPHDVMFHPSPGRVNRPAESRGRSLPEAAAFFAPLMVL